MKYSEQDNRETARIRGPSSNEKLWTLLTIFVYHITVQAEQTATRHRELMLVAIRIVYY